MCPHKSKTLMNNSNIFKYNIFFLLRVLAVISKMSSNVSGVKIIWGGRGTNETTIASPSFEFSFLSVL